MKYLPALLASLIFAAACSKAPVKPTDPRGLSANTGDASADESPEHDDHDDHEHEEAGTDPAAAVSAHAEDLELLKAWTKGQYVGNEQLQLSYLATVPLK